MPPDAQCQFPHDCPKWLGLRQSGVQCAQLGFKFLRWLGKLPVFSIIYNHPSEKPPFSSRDRLSCPIIVDIMRLFRLKSLIYPVAHLPLHTATGWHLQKPPICCYLTHRHAKAIFCSAGPPSHSLSNDCLCFSSPLSRLQFAAVFCSHCQTASLQLGQLFFCFCRPISED